MPSPEYFAWAKRHTALFAFSPSDVEKVKFWLAEFETRFFNADELHAATTAMVAGDKLFPGDHVNAIVRHVLTERSAALVAHRDEQTRIQLEGCDAKGFCELCANTRWVIVPHPDYLSEWTEGIRFVECGVACKCHLGRLTLENWNPDRPKPLTFDHYESRVQNWRDFVAMKANIDRARAKSRTFPRGPMDEALDRIRGRMESAKST